MRRNIAIGVLAALVLSAPVAFAQQRATKKQITAAFVGKTAEFSDGTAATYGADGSYVFRSAQGESKGLYAIGEGIICVKFAQVSRCDDILKEGDSFIVVNSDDGKNYSVKLR
jgi:hypothetical protein